MSKNNLELADVFRQFYPQYIEQYGHQMMPSQRRAAEDIMSCMTAEKGGDYPVIIFTWSQRCPLNFAPSS